MIDINNWISITPMLDNGAPTPPAYPTGQIDNALNWNKYFYDLEQYHYQMMLNSYNKIDDTLMLKADIQFKGIG